MDNDRTTLCRVKNGNRKGFWLGNQKGTINRYEIVNKLIKTLKLQVKNTNICLLNEIKEKKNLGLNNPKQF